MFSGTVCIKRFALGFAAFFISLAPALAQDVAFTFSNELSSDIVNVGPGGTEFAGIEDEVIIEMTSERVDLGVDIIFGFDLSGGATLDKPRLYYSQDDFDWFAKFRPIGFLEFGLSEDYQFAGSYMYVEDDNVSGGKMGSGGLSVAFVGGGVMDALDGLKIAFTMPFSEFGEDNVFEEFAFGFGAEYAFGELFSVGAAVNSNVVEGERKVGAGASVAFFPIEGLSIYAGYSFRDGEGLMDVVGDHLVNASISYEADRFAVGADFLTNFGLGFDGAPSDYDLYAALYGEFNVMDPLLVFLTLTDQNTLGNEAEWALSVAPGVEFDTGRFGAFSLEVEVAFDQDGFNQVCFPLSWTYEF